MYTVQDLKASLMEESRIIKHLATKVPNAPEGYEYKPSAYQRSLRELMSYLMRMGTMMITYFQDPNSSEKAKELRLESESVDLKDFAAAMDRQMGLVGAYLDSLTEDDLHQEIDPFSMGQTQSLKQYLFGALSQTFTAYRMQLFLYIKSAGNVELDTFDVWMGMDNPHK